jgi:beta-lactamase class A
MRSDLPFVLLLLLLLFGGCASSGPEAGVAAPAAAPPRPDRVLQRALEEAVRGFGGDVGVYVRHLPTGATASLRADELFPTASMIKVPLLVALFDQVERGRLRLDQELTFADSLRYADYDLTAKFREGETIPLSQLAFLMVALSDNTASLWIQSLVGGGAAVNRWLEEHGFRGTRVNSRTPGRRPDWEVYGWGQTTPREIAELLVRIRQGRAVTPAASEQMYRLLTKSYWDDKALSALPTTVQAASKQGVVDRSRSEVLLVNAPTGDYVLAVITRNQQDTTHAADNEGFRLLREVSRVVYRHFNPDAGG